MTARRRVVRVPASSANLGPGYDVMAAALDLFLELEVEETGEFSFDPAGLDVPTGRDNLIVRAFESLHSADGIAFRIRESIPLGRGLGSSAAAIVAGLVAADHLYELALSEEELLARGAEIEGHPDNVAAAIFGGFVICDPAGDGPPDASRFPPPDGLEGILVIPNEEEVATERAREAIPNEIPLGDALGNIFSAARLTLGLYRGDLSLIAASLKDNIHQGRRRDLYPRSMELVEGARDLGALGATISGAGPTVLVWTTWQDAGKVVEELESRCQGWAEIRRIPFTPHGADVPEL
ncbi:MAG TPA: homoserine kinase [Solirubrobacterales bacterium]|nr:homoserine kinase [Solirubrobacterales bacterium]